MHRAEIEEKLATIFINRFAMDFINNPDMKEMKILSKNGIPARELLHVYYDVKKTYGITIPEEEIVNRKFDSFNNIVGVIERQFE